MENGKVGFLSWLVEPIDFSQKKIVEYDGIISETLIGACIEESFIKMCQQESRYIKWLCFYDIAFSTKQFEDENNQVIYNVVIRDNLDEYDFSIYTSINGTVEKAVLYARDYIDSKEESGELFVSASCYKRSDFVYNTVIAFFVYLVSGKETLYDMVHILKLNDDIEKLIDYYEKIIIKLSSN